MGRRLHALFVLVTAMAVWLGIGPGAEAAPSVVATVTVGAGPQSVAVNAATNKIYVARSGFLTRIDGVTNTATFVSAGSGTYDVAVNQVTNRVYVSRFGGLSVYNGSTLASLASVSISGTPKGVAVNETTNRVYVASSQCVPTCIYRVTVVDGATNSVVTDVGLSGEAEDLAVNETTNRVYAAQTNGFLAVINGATNAVIASVAVGGTPFGVATDPASNLVYVTRFAFGQVAIVNGATNAVSATVTVGAQPRGVATKGNRAYVANSGSNSVSVIQGNSVVGTVTVQSFPWGIDANAATERVYVANFNSGTVSVVLDDPVPPDTSITSSPTNPSAADVSFAFTGSDNVGVAGFECALDGFIVPTYAPCLSPKAYTGLSTGSHAFRVRAVDGGGNVDPTPAVFTWTVDATPPETTITSQPSNPSTANASFSFAATDNLPGLTFECRLDGGTFTACTSPASYALAGGTHAFEVRARDAVGNLDPTPASHTWLVDAAPPDTFLISGPPAIGGTSATFEFLGTDNHTPSSSLGFRCRLDGGSPEACTSPKTYNGLAGGSHNFEVAAVDQAGNIDPSPASRTWLIEASPADTSITSGPADPTNDTSASIDFTGSDDTTPSAQLTFECRLDGGSFAPCTSPATYTGLAEGGHSFDVRATDAFGNTDPSPASHAWTIDLTPPETAISSTPEDPTNDRSASFAFGGSDDLGPVTFECSLDGADFGPCSSPASYADLAPGQHTFEVRSVDGAGNADQTPASFTWSIDGGAPESTFDTPDGAVVLALPGFIVTPVTGDVTDDVSGVDTVTVTFTRLAPAGGSQTLEASVSCDDTDRLACHWSALAPTAGGRYEVSVSADDQLGNVESPGPAPITVVVVAGPGS